MRKRSRRFLLILFILALATFVRVRAALELPIDFDEPIYVRAGLHYAQAIQEKDLAEIARYDYNIEHPALVKLTYGVGIALLGPDLDPASALDISRMVSVGFGVALVALVAWVEPFAGLALALHTMNTKYTSQAYLEALPAFASALCVLACARSDGRRNRWFWLSAVALGVTAAGKYIYLVAGLVVAGWWLWDIRQGTLQWRDLFLFGLVALLVFLALNPVLWADPLGRLVESVTFHSAYTESDEVTRYGYAWSKPLDYMSRSWPVQWHGSIFLLPLDELIFLSGLAGLGWLLWPTHLGVSLRRAWARWRGRGNAFTNEPETLSRQQGLILAWFLAGVLFLFVWPTKWPQYTLITATPLCLAGGLAISRAWRWILWDREYWGKLSLDVLPREFWVTVSVLALLTGGLVIWRSVVRHRHLRGWTVFNRETSPLPSNLVQAVALDQEGRVWLGTARGVAVLEWPQEDEPRWRIYNQDNSDLPENDVLVIATDDEGKIWIGTRGSLTRFDPGAREWTTWTPSNSPLPGGELRDVTPVPGGGVWVATSAGAAVLAPTGEWRVYNTTNSDLLSDAVFDIAVQEDPAGTRVWFATFEGVSILDLENGVWTGYTSKDSELTWDSVSSIAIDGEERLWFATYGRGVSTLSPNGEWQNYTVRSSDIPWSIVTTVSSSCPCGGRPAGLWFGTEGPGAGLGEQLAAYEPPAEWRVYGYKNSGLPDSAVSDIAVQCGDPKTCEGLRVWVATRTAGLAVYEPPRP